MLSGPGLSRSSRRVMDKWRLGWWRVPLRKRRLLDLVDWMVSRSGSIHLVMSEQFRYMNKGFAVLLNDSFY